MLEIFNHHVDQCGEPLKEDILKKALELKGNDYKILGNFVEELKQNEGIELQKLGAQYQQKTQTVQKKKAQVERNEQIILQWIDQWRIRRIRKAWYRQKKEEYLALSREKKADEFCRQFHDRGLKMRTIRHFKLWSQLAGNKMQKRRKEKEIEDKVHAAVYQKKAHREFLESMVKELEEKYRIELRKKAILKNQCDQAYLRGVTAISQEALKMSSSTLEDYYRGMKMPNYDGQNVYNQMRQMNAGATAASQVHQNMDSDSYEK